MSSIHYVYINTCYSHVSDENNDTEVGMDDFAWDTHSMDGMFSKFIAGT
jgi:hypothetical protein